MIAVEVLTGRHPFYGLSDNAMVDRLNRGRSDDWVASVGDSAWRKLCRGLLRREPGHRWRMDNALLWLQNPNDPKLIVPDEDAARSAESSGLLFVGKRHTTTASLAEAFAEHWDIAAEDYQSKLPDLRIWLRHDLGKVDMVEAIDQIDKDRSKSNLDSQLFQMIRILDPKRNPSFRGISLTEEGLRACSERAARDQAAGDVLHRLYASNILHVTGRADLIRQHEVWYAAFQEYARLRAKLQSAGGVTLPEINNDVASRVLLLAASVPGSRAALAQLRERARSSANAAARACPWFAELGDPATASPVALIAMAQVATHAEAWTRAREAEKRADLERQREAARVGRAQVAAVRGKWAFWGGAVGLGLILAAMLAVSAGQHDGTPVVVLALGILGGLLGLGGGPGGAIIGLLVGVAIGLVTHTVLSSVYAASAALLLFAGTTTENINVKVVVFTTVAGATISLCLCLLYQSVSSPRPGLNRGMSFLVGGGLLAAMLAFPTLFIQREAGVWLATIETILRTAPKGEPIPARLGAAWNTNFKVASSAVGRFTPNPNGSARLQESTDTLQRPLKNVGFLIRYSGARPNKTSLKISLMNGENALSTCKEQPIVFSSGEYSCYWNELTLRPGRYSFRLLTEGLEYRHNFIVK